ncbi:hypothetical protein GLOIN_2v1633679 [Rhizophagus irregularis DAOM 181602=DAOM 197198]|uniref:Uncharacterized protein n=1 Tax=Rhizophagus irregularis (strain DAOM 181602 / DAOM 197198 / MUCL 43194) TaxID=747089 RepID=A0A2P4PTP7_RHIID|nr:hypothetical protein GLOIN_2v1633679 [Rhizophagus irregularis DAOM 181602=DAOM 197198]POG68756.1 hypothetical protein GLOIN_2v1633679 [Rhizophagus irregularis DAOM 181602=DAOM 197198]|eukprot:XP_025175622.1 hypothetical protein GLOIN_2v1633679 [Rhizophagus irregularis DAOM 181602=DAOM 197198]
MCFRLVISFKNPQTLRVMCCLIMRWKYQTQTMCLKNVPIKFNYRTIYCPIMEF